MASPLRITFYHKTGHCVIQNRPLRVETGQYPRYPIDAQYDLIVRGTSINRFAHDGYRLRVVDTQKTGLEVPEGGYAIVRRFRDDGQIVETTAKRLKRRSDGKFELWPDSSDPQWQTPIIMGSDPEREIVEVIAMVLYSYRSARGRAGS